jgi:hypothetical protein
MAGVSMPLGVPPLGEHEPPIGVEGVVSAAYIGASPSEWHCPSGATGVGDKSLH